MITYEDFKKAHGVDGFDFGRTNAGKLITHTISPRTGEKLIIVSKLPEGEGEGKFSMKEPAYIYEAKADDKDDDGVVIGKTDIYVLSNKKAKNTVRF